MRSAFFERLRSRKRQADQSALAKYEELVRRGADGEEPSEDEVDSILTAAGKGPDELQADVELLERRRKLRATADKLPERQEVIDRIKKEIADNDAEFQKARVKHKSTGRKLEEKLLKAGEAVAESESAEQALRTQLQGELKARQERYLTRRRELLKEIKDIEQKLTLHVEEIGRQQKVIERTAKKADEGSSVAEGEVASAKKIISEREAAKKRWQEQLAPLQKQLAELDKEGAEIEKLSLVA